MDTKFNEYFGNFSGIFYFGISEDSRTKLAGLEYLIQIFHSNMSNEDDANDLVFDIKVCFIMYFSIYRIIWKWTTYLDIHHNEVHYCIDRVGAHLNDEEKYHDFDILSW